MRIASVSPRRRLTAATLTAAVAAALVGAIAPVAIAADPVTDVPAVLETTPSPLSGDTVDDMAIWVDPADATRSVVIGADHANHSLDVYDLSGARLHSVDILANNVDLRTGFSLGGASVPIVGIAGSGNMAFFALDPVTRELSNVTKGGTIKVTSAHGMCLYHSATSGDFFAFAVNRSGILTQFKLVDEGGQVATQAVRTIDVDPRVPADANGNDALEECAADDEGASVFVGEQDWHIWRYPAEPDAPTGTADRTLIDSDVTEGGHFDRDVEGLAVVNEPGGGGFLLASSQGDFTFNVYRRTAPYDFIRKVRVAKSATSDGCERTDGIDAVAANLGPAFPRGLFVCQDNTNTAPAEGNMNFKFARLEDVVPLGDAPLPSGSTTTTTTAPPGPGPQTPPPTGSGSDTNPVAVRSGYWMVGNDGAVYAFGDSRHLGNASVPSGVLAVDLEPTPSSSGYWIVDDQGHVFASGDAAHLGNADTTKLVAGEKVTSISATPTGAGYWLFTTKGRVMAKGDAVHFGDVSAIKLNGPVLDSIPTPSGRGYYMVASDGGIFTFGDAVFHGSTGSIKLNAPVQSLVPNPLDGGYWLVASDGGVFTFGNVPFRGSMGSTKLNKPMTGMVPYGNGYLMVAEDGGIFNFSDKAFLGSLGSTPPARPVVSVASLDG